MSASEVQASVVQIDITPPVGMPMEGYGAREGVSQGVHDPLVAQLLLLEGSTQRLVLITADLLGVRLGVTKSLREAIERAIGPSDGLMMACSHTHSGPAGFMPDVPGLRTYSDPDYQQFIERKIAGASLQANRRAAMNRLSELLTSALKKRPVRKKTSVPYSAHQRRLRLHRWRLDVQLRNRSPGR